MEFDGECYKHKKYFEGISSLSDGSETLLDVFLNQCKICPRNSAYGAIVNESVEWITYEASRNKVLNLYDFFEKEVEKGCIIGLYSINRYEWMISEHTIYALGGVSCSLYSTYGTEAIVHILKQTEMSICFMSGDKAESLYDDILMSTRTHLKCVVIFDSFKSEQKYLDLGIKVYYFQEIANKYHYTDRILSRLMRSTERRPKIDDLATICYTSGTSGIPKGVMLTHKNFIVSIDAFFRCTESISFYKITKEDVYISYLPLSHVMERVCVHTLISKGASIGFYRGIVKDLAKDYKIISPTFVAGVPKVFNFFRDRILERVWKKNMFQQCLFRIALRWKYFLQRFGCYTSILDYFIFNQVKREFGGRIRGCLSGSAPLNSDVIRFLQATLSCKIFQGYGQTETTAASIVAPMEETTIETVGIPFPSNKIKLVSLGGEYDNGLEIWTKGENVFQEYFKNEAETKECFEDGWFKTGDIGVVKNNLFSIVGRKKEIFKTSQGEYIVPEKIENLLQCPEVDDILVSGKSTEDFIVAIVVCTKGLTEASVQNAVWALANKAVGKKKMMKFEIPRKIMVLKEPFTTLGDFITPTGKKKRAALEKALRRQIESLYTNS